jgi:hydroxymethylbilane synthase
LRRLDAGGYDAIVLAAAGLERLGLGARIREVFDPSVLLPAAGQGALGLEIRTDRTDVAALLAPLAHAQTGLAVTAERAVSRIMGGSCSMPLAAFATWHGASLLLQAAWGDPTGKLPVVRVQASAQVSDGQHANALGERVAALLQTQVVAAGGLLPSAQPRDAA